MKVSLKTNFSFRTARSGEVDLPPSVTTVGALLAHVGMQADFVLVDGRAENVRPDVEVLVNGRDLSFYPEGLKTPLKNGDVIDIALMTLGGG